MARPPEQISVMDVLEAIDPKRSLFECGEIRRDCKLFGAEPPTWCVTGPCRIHFVMQEAERALRSVLMSKSLADLGHEFEHKVPDQFLRDAEIWFQRSRSRRTNKKVGKGLSEGSRQQPCSPGNRRMRLPKKKEIQHD